MKSFKGQFTAKQNVRCDRCGRIIGPSSPVKVGYRQFGIAQGTFCNNTCCRLAYEEVIAAHPELLENAPDKNEEDMHGIFTRIR